MSNDDDEPYKVGYKCPPMNTRFKPGMSGNPAGRPQKNKKKTFWESLEDVTNSTVCLKQGENIINVEIKEAVLRRLANDAMQGKPGALRMFIQLMEKNSPIEESMQIPGLIICPPSGPAPPEPPVFGEDDQ